MPQLTREDAEGLARAARGHKRLLILTHNNPDPDALAAAVGVSRLLAEMNGQETQVAYAGFLSRAQNKQMVERLRLDVANIDDLDMRRYRAAVLIDTQPGVGNNALSPTQEAVAVVDHHGVCKAGLGVKAAVLDPHVGATSTLVYELLRAAEIEPDAALATALFFGLKTDTQDLGREATDRDLTAYKELFDLVNHQALATIIHARLSSDYFRVMHRALESATIAGDCIYVPVGDVPTPEFISEIADYIVALNGIRWAVVTGRYSGNLYFSLRTHTARKDAGEMLQEAVGEHGLAGGHQKMAGGLLPLGNLPEAKREAAEASVISKLFELLGADTGDAIPLLAPSSRQNQGA